MSHVVKLVFCMRHSGYMRLYEPLLRHLDRQGHRVKILIRRVNPLYDEGALRHFCDPLAHVSWEVFSEPNKEDPRVPVHWIRSSQDYLRYLHPDYRDADKLRERAAQRLSPRWRSYLDRNFGPNGKGGGERRRWALIRALRAWDRLQPAPTGLVEKLESESADAMLITPVVDIPSTQLSWLKAARQLGLPALYLVASWDNLTNKGLVQLAPDVTFVWNRFQVDEAERYHRLDRRSVIPTGSQAFDRWFETEPATTSSEFSSDVGLPEDRPYILYLCSSPFIAPDEVSFVRRWIEALRSSEDPRLESTPILIRPHPQNRDQWQGFDPSDYADVAIHPRAPDPDKERGRRAFFDAMAHSRAVVGINTSAMIEAGIAGKKVFTIQDPHFRDTQDGTLHFRYLKEGGLVEVAIDLGEHVEQLESVFRESDTDREDREAFLGEFIRPHGLDRSATEILGENIVEHARRLSATRTAESSVRRGARAVALSAFGIVQWIFFSALVPLLVVARVAKSGMNPRPVAVLLRDGVRPKRAKKPADRGEETSSIIQSFALAPLTRLARWLRRGSISQCVIATIVLPFMVLFAAVGLVWTIVHRVWGLIGVLIATTSLLGTSHRRNARSLALLILRGRPPKKRKHAIAAPRKAVMVDERPDPAAEPRSPRSKNEAIEASLRQIAKTQRRMANLHGECVSDLEDLAELASSDQPIIVGPWLSEVGFELLYWVPFLQWAIEHLGIDRDRLLIVSRGGAQNWYQNIGDRYEDLLDHHSPAEFRRKNETRIAATGGQKHVTFGDVDREFLRPVLEKHGIGEHRVLHPKLMYRLLNPYWKRLAAPSFVDHFSSFRRLEGPADLLPWESALPRDFVAAKFYFSSSFPDTPANRQFQRDFLAQLGRDNDVVLLNTGLALDDHSELLDGIPSRVRLLDAEMLPSNNLDVQTRVIARSRLFAGTYGGFSYLAPFYGVPSIAFHSEEGNFVPGHLDVAYRAFRKLRVGFYDGVIKNPNDKTTESRRAQFTAIDVDHWPDLRDVLLPTPPPTTKARPPAHGNGNGHLASGPTPVEEDRSSAAVRRQPQDRAER